MSLMRIGIIDLGTNSVRFDVHEIDDKRRTRILHRERLMVRLGQGVFVNGQMDREAIARTTEAFASFRYTADQLGVRKIVAIATSAVRQASDREKLIQAIKRRSGIEVRVISGDEEARLIAAGILSLEKNLPKKFAMVDIGGGSTEISFSKDRRITWSASFNLGTARLEQLFNLSRPGMRKKACELRIKELRLHIQKLFEQYESSRALGRVKDLVGSSGTAKALVKLEGRGDATHRTLARSFLKRLIKKMCGMSREQLLKIPGMDSSRVDMILVGAVLLDEVMDILGANKLRLTDYALREGILDEELKLIKDKRASHLGLHLADLEEILKRPLVNAAYTQRVGAVCEALFHRLAPVHRLKDQWKSLLKAAALLQNSGRSISALGHNEHSFYIAEHLDFPWFEIDERRIIAHLCRWHGEGKIAPKDLSFIKSPKERSAFLKTVALLRLANALVWHDRSSVKILRVTFSAREVHIKLWANGARELVKLRIESRKKLFEKVFKRHLVIDT